MADFSLIVGLDVNASYNEFQKQLPELKRMLDANPLRIKIAVDTNSIKSFQSQVSNITAAINSEASATRVSAESHRQHERQVINEISVLKNLSTVLGQGQRNLTNFTAAENSRNAASREAYTRLKAETDALNSSQQAYIRGALSVSDLRDRVSQYRLSLKETENVIKNNGDATKTFAERMGGLANKFSAWLSVSQLIMLVVRSIRRMISASIELDSAMTQMQVVTRANSAEMREFGNAAAKAAKQIGSSITDFVSSATTFARLGYSMDESSLLAKYTGMLQNVGNIDVTDAQDAITSIVKAFSDEIDIDNIETVMDKLVTVGNNFPISVSQIAEGMNNASSALSAAGNTFEQSVALLTAANTTVQNASKSSTGLRTIAARIRNTKTELDELGEVMTEANYEELVKTLTDEQVALTNINGEYRSTYDIMADIAAKWDDMTSDRQAALATALAGTRQQDVFYSLIGQFQEASGAMESMADSSGALNEAYSTFMESIQAHINQFKATFESLANSSFTRDFLNSIIDIGTALIGVIEKIMKTINAIGGLNTVLAITASNIIALNISGIIAKGKAIIDICSKFVQIIPAAITAITTGSKAAASAFYMLGGWATLIPVIVAAASGLAIVISKLIVTQKEAYAEAEKLHSKYEETASQISNLEDELKTTHDKIAELQRLSNEGIITLVEQEELTKLQTTNAELERELELKRMLAQEDAKESNEGLIGAYNKLEYKPLLSEDQKIIRRYKDIEDELANLSSKGLSNTQEYDALLNEQLDLYEAYITASSNIMHNRVWGLQDTHTDAVTYAKDLADEYKYFLNLQKEGTELSDRDIERFKYVRSEMLEMDKLLREDYIDKYVGDSPEKQGWLDAVDYMERLLMPAQYFNDKLTHLPKQISETFTTLGIESKLTAKDVEKLADEFPELKQLMEDTGWTADDLVSHFNALGKAQEEIANPSGGNTGALDYSKLGESLSKAEDGVNKMSSALKEFNSDGAISSKTFADLAANFGKLDSFQSFVDVMSNGASTAEEMKTALENLAGEYIDDQIAANSLTDETAALTIRQLENIGVTNAEEVVTSRLAQQKLLLAIQNINLANATNEEKAAIANSIEALYNEAVAAGGDEQMLSLLTLAKEIFNSTHINTSSDIDNLINLATNAGIAAEQLAKAYIAKRFFEQAESSSGRKAAHARDMAGRYTSAAESDIVSSINSALSNVSITPPQFSFSGYGGTRNSATGTKTAAKAVEEYIADIEAYREAIKKLNDTKADIADIERRIDNSEDLKEQIELQKELIEAYGKEQTALHNLNDLRDTTIHDNVDSLRELGFVIEYNDETNELWIENLEHLNELTATSAGEYDTLEEATNALREETEKLIDDTNALNDANQENSETWKDLAGSTKDARKEIISLLNEIVSNASDAVDAIQNVYNVLHSAADEFDADGFIMVDTFQSIIGLGAQYMQYLTDENGLLVINEERINAVIAAKTRELALEQAYTYVERLRLALEKNAIESLNELLYATVDTTNATWGLVYANLKALDLTDEQYKAARHNIDALRSLGEAAAKGVGMVAGEAAERLNNMKSGLDDILNYVMDMLKHRINEQKDALEDMKDAFGDIIDMRKESLEDAKKETDYQKKIAKQVQEIAKIQSKINALALDDSREAKAQRAKLEEELAELQESLADEQSDHAKEAQEDALDDMQKAYEEEKDAEIKKLEESISSTQKLYDMAIDYIENHWDTLYDELISWNTEYGSVLNSEITSAWENCLAAAERYGSYVSALKNIDSDISSMGSSGTSTVVGETYAHSVVAKMKANSAQWNAIQASVGGNTETSEQKALRAENLNLGKSIGAYIDGDGVWWLPDGRRLYDAYEIHHTGGIAGNNPTPRQNEVMSILQKGEAVLDEERERGLYRLIDFVKLVSNKVGTVLSPGSIGSGLFGGGSAIQAIRGLAASGGDYTFNPIVNVNINHNGSLTAADAQRYGKLAADSTLQELSDAFAKRGVTALGGATLK